LKAIARRIVVDTMSRTPAVSFYPEVEYTTPSTRVGA